MDEDEVSDVGKPLRPDKRREQTDVVFREMREKEAAERRAKSERFKKARLSVSKDDQ